MITCETWAAMHGFVADYWRRVDGQRDTPVDALYAEDGLMHIGSERCEGRAQIRDFFARRAAQQQALGRSTRHVVSNLLVEQAQGGRLRVHSTVLVLAGTGGWPMPSQPPATVADFEDLLAEAAPGRWLIEQRRGTAVFIGTGAAGFVR